MGCVGAITIVQHKAPRDTSAACRSQSDCVRSLCVDPREWLSSTRDEEVELAPVLDQ